VTTVHYDRGVLGAPVGGFVVGRAARTHDASAPLVYETGDEYRDLDELQAICRDLARGVVVVWDHMGARVGVTVGARIDGDHVVVEMDLDPATRKRLKADKRELSLGYTCTVDAQKYQRGISVFELALVERARCGGTCCLTRVDAAHEHRDEQTLMQARRAYLSSAWRNTDEDY
jgi:hypothetical protein